MKYGADSTQASDFGSGTGRATHLVSAFPFKRIIGIECLSPIPSPRLASRIGPLNAACAAPETMKASQSPPDYGGPKRLALQRLLGKAIQRGRVIVLVLPVSPTFRHEVLSRDDVAAFERNLAELRRWSGGVTWVRVDEVPELLSEELFYDFLHSNAHGRRVATRAALGALGSRRPAG